MAEVELVKVSKRYGSVVALSDLDFRINDGEFVTLLGPSGCGKTTALNLIAGLDEVTSGQILMDGAVVNDLTPLERDVAMVFQSYALYPHMTVRDNIGFTLKLRKRPRNEIRGRVAAVAEMLELGHLLDRRPRELSGGQQQRVALGRAVIREPRLFLFDEPFSNLDAALRVRMRMEIKELHQKLKITSLFVTHDQEEALSISDRIAIMRNGKIEQVGTSEEVYGQPASRYVARFIGSPPMDILAGAVEREAGTTYYRVGAARFEIPDRAVPQHDGEMDLGVRPEHVALGSAGQSATATVIQPVGPITYVTVAWDGGRLTSAVQGISHLRPGDVVHVSLVPEAVLFFDRATELRVATPVR
jgi:multiple sugar transport system ATP-binding protein